MNRQKIVLEARVQHIGRATHFVVSGWQEMSKGGQKLQSGRLTHLVDQQICWYGWCWLAVPFVVSVPFDDKISWYGHAFRINILYNWPILLMDKQQMVDLQNQHSVQFSQMLAGGEGTVGQFGPSCGRIRSMLLFHTFCHHSNSLLPSWWDTKKTMFFVLIVSRCWPRDGHQGPIFFDTSPYSCKILV